MHPAARALMRDISCVVPGPNGERTDDACMRTLTIAIVLAMLLGLPASAQPSIPLWPEGRMPNMRGLALKDSVANERICRVGTPGMWTFFPSAEENTGSAVVILPSGGYHHLTYVLGGTQLAKWFNTMGMSAFVLKYRLPNSPDLEERSIGPLQDVQRAMRLVRTRTDAWGIAPDRVGIMGASAGGHLAATLSTHAEDVASIGDTLDNEPFAPDFMILVLPVIDMDEYTHAGSRHNLLGDDPPPEQVEAFSLQTRVTSATPPTFLAHASDDSVVSSMNSVLFYRALLEHEVPASLHVFPQGGHAIALRRNPGSTDLWTALCEAWLGEMDFLPAPTAK